MKHLTWSLLVVASLSAAPAGQTFTGVITDDMCGKCDPWWMQIYR